jgi:hypothetical protein
LSLVDGKILLRICLGRYFGLNSVWILAATILTAFDVSKPLNVDGNEVEPRVEFSNGVVR